MSIDFQPFDLANEIVTYFNQWQEDELSVNKKLSATRINKLVKLISNHDDAMTIYEDFERYFNTTGDRPDVMSDTFTDILDCEFEDMFEDYM